MSKNLYFLQAVLIEHRLLCIANIMFFSHIFSTVSEIKLADTLTEGHDLKN
jgi:hypothetical protein